MSNATDTTNQDLPKVVITLGVLAGALLIGLLIAKLADYLYERSSVRDDASDISEHTRELLKTQIELMRMGKTKDKKDDKKDDPADEKETAAKVAGVWSSKVKAKAKLNPIPETGEAAEEQAAAKQKPEKSSETNSKSKTGASVSYKVSDASKKDDVKKYQDAVKVWNEVEKTSEEKVASSNKSPSKTGNEKGEPANGKVTAKTTPKKDSNKDASTKKSPETNGSKSTKDEEFDVPENIAAPSKSSKSSEKKKSTTVLIPDNLSKNADIRPITPAKPDENMPGYMRPKTPFTPRNFSRYNGTSDPTKSSEKSTPQASAKTS